jgi:hypothetical protein
MNPASSPLPGVGGGFPAIPIWYPPVSMKWLATGLLLFLGAVAHRVKPHLRQYFVTPFGFFGTAVLAYVLYESVFPPMAFALLFVLLMMWSAQMSNEEGWRGGGGGEAIGGRAAGSGEEVDMFLNYSDMDYVNNNKRWFVERVLKEKPLGIQEKDVATYPVSGY